MSEKILNFFFSDELEEGSKQVLAGELLVVHCFQVEKEWGLKLTGSLLKEGQEVVLSDACTSVSGDGKAIEIDLKGMVRPGVKLAHSIGHYSICLLYTSPSPRDRTRSRMPSSA